MLPISMIESEIAEQLNVEQCTLERSYANAVMIAYCSVQRFFSGPRETRQEKRSKNRPNAYSGGGRGILASLLSDSIVSGQCLMSIMIT
jgi:hypothetical protein